MEIQISDRLEKIVGKGEIARYEQFLLLPQCFQKLSAHDASKWVSVEQRVKTETSHSNGKLSCLQPFSKRQILDSSKLKDTADDNFKFEENGGKSS